MIKKLLILIVILFMLAFTNEFILNTKLINNKNDVLWNNFPPDIPLYCYKCEAQKPSVSDNQLKLNGYEYCRWLSGNKYYGGMCEFNWTWKVYVFN